jgi:hypothetical protein
MLEGGFSSFYQGLEVVTRRVKAMWQSKRALSFVELCVELLIGLGAVSLFG